MGVTITCGVVQDSLTGKGPLRAHAGSGGESHVDIWPRALLAEGTARIKVLVMVLWDCQGFTWRQSGWKEVSKGVSHREKPEACGTRSWRNQTNPDV